MIESLVLLGNNPLFKTDELEGQPCGEQRRKIRREERSLGKYKSLILISLAVFLSHRIQARKDECAMSRFVSTAKYENAKTVRGVQAAPSDRLGLQSPSTCLQPHTGAHLGSF
jgi:hypothetical protein